MDQLQTPPVVPPPQAPRFATSKVVIAILSLFSLLLLITLSSVVYQNKELRASNRELIWNLAKPSEVMRDVTQDDKGELLQEEMPATETSIICPVGFTFFENEYMSFCYPERFETVNQGRTILMASTGETIDLDVNFEGGFYSPCSTSDSVLINELKAMRISNSTYTSVEGELDKYNCSSEYTMFITIIEVEPSTEVSTHLKNVILYLSADINSPLILDLNEYKQIEQSIKIKKEYFKE